jgi:hypothetical protein
MSDDQYRYLKLLGELPARLTAEQVAWVLNCQPHNVSVVVMTRLFKQLGNPMPNSVKHVAALDILELRKDRTWLGKVTNALGQHRRERNLDKKRLSQVIGNNGQSPLWLFGTQVPSRNEPTEMRQESMR